MTLSAESRLGPYEIVALSVPVAWVRSAGRGTRGSREKTGAIERQIEELGRVQAA